MGDRDTHTQKGVLYFNPLVPDAHYSERQDKLASLQNKLLEDSRW